MSKKSATLVVMAAGMGSRFGGLKQMEPVDELGHAILDYSVFDAVRAGFDHVIFIVKEEIIDAFREKVGRRIEQRVDTSYVCQELTSMLPEGFQVPEGRVKPWGTGHAVLCARELTHTPFGIINADDFYGPDSFAQLYSYLVSHDDPCMVGYQLGNTLTENGTVARGICRTENGLLKEITEHTSLDRNSGFPLDTVVSMNMWGFRPEIFDTLEKGFRQFLTHLENPLKQEFFLPSVVDGMIQRGVPVHVMLTHEKWYGVTYRDDLESVQNALRSMREGGLYDGL